MRLSTGYEGGYGGGGGGSVTSVGCSLFEVSVEVSAATQDAGSTGFMGAGFVGAGFVGAGFVGIGALFVH